MMASRPYQNNDDAGNFASDYSPQPNSGYKRHSYFGNM